MGKTIREFVSDVNADLKASNIDNWISPKAIYEKAKDIISDFLKKDNSSNLALYTQEEGWSQLPCVEMEEYPLASCGLDINICQKVMKSKKRLPELYTSKVAPLIKEVASINYGNTYNYIKSFSQWKSTQKREFISKRYFVIIDGYLYIPVGKNDTVSNPEKVNFTGYFQDKQQVDEFNNGKSCKKIADYEMVIPSYLLNDVKKEILNQFRSVYLQIRTDELPNMNTNEITNQKTVG